MPFDPHFVDRRDFLRVAGLGGAALLTPALRGLEAATDYDPAACKLMEFDVSYRTQIKNLPSDAENVRIWMPLPPTDDAQQISRFEIESPLPYRITKEPVFGSRMLFVEAGVPDDIEAPYGIELRYRVTRRRGHVQKVEMSEAELEKHLKLTSKVRVTDDVEAFASKVIRNATDPYEIGRRVFDGIREELFYDKTIPGCGTGDTQWIMKHKRGKCDDYHALFMAILISRGVPIRWEQGFPLPYPVDGKVEAGQLAGDCTGSHCWASFYAPDHGWVPVDVSEADKAPVNADFFFGNLSPNRFQVSVGRSVTLNPPQGGDPLPTFAFAYAEADEIPLIYLANYENIIKYDITSVEMM